MLLSSLAFAVMVACAHALRSQCDWQVIVLVRAALQLAFALVLAWLGGVRLAFWPPRQLWVRSVGGSIAMVCQFYAYTRLPMADVLTLANMFPIWVALLSWPLVRRVPSASVWLAAVTGILGVVLIQQPRLADGSLAAGLALASSVFTAVAMIALHQLRDLDARAVIVHFSAVALVFCFAALFLFDRPYAAFDVWDAPALLLLLGVGTAAVTGQLLLTKAYALGDAARVSVVGLTQIVFALAFDVLLFEHTFDAVALLGMALVVTPTAWLMLARER
jgi:drug/metabolite transporter (DMT)-like permease